MENEATKVAIPLRALIALGCGCMVVALSVTMFSVSTTQCVALREDYLDALRHGFALCYAMQETQLLEETGNIFDFMARTVSEAIAEQLTATLHESEALRSIAAAVDASSGDPIDWLKPAAGTVHLTIRAHGDYRSSFIRGGHLYIGDSGYAVSIPVANECTAFVMLPNGTSAQTCRPGDGWPAGETVSVPRTTQPPPSAALNSTKRWPSIHLRDAPRSVGYSTTGLEYDGQGVLRNSGVGIELDSVSELFRRLADTYAHDDLTVHIYTCVASSWQADHLRELNRSDWQDFSQVGILTGVSIGGVYEGAGADLKLVADVNASNPSISMIAMGIHDLGGYAVAAAQPFVVLEHSHGDVFATDLAVVKRISMDSGLDWWVVVSLQYEPILAHVAGKRAATMAGVDVIVADNDARDKEARNVSYGIQCGLVVIIILVAYAAATYIVTPLLRIQGQMEEYGATMDLAGGIVQTKSYLYEIRCMQYNFNEMVARLGEYKAYVPAGLLHDGHIQEPPTGDIAILFSDIKGSTKLWDKSATDMNAAMDLHNDAIREAYSKFRGYEVKTIGDSFMISFQDVQDAVKAGLEIQLELARQDWPAGLELEDGLIVRIGIHCGQAVAEHNPLTGRVDYRGTVVNLASRVEGKATGGTLCLTEELADRVKGALSDLGNPIVIEMGEQDIKGLGSGYKLTTFCPQQLAYRVGMASSTPIILALPSTCSSDGDRVQVNKKTGLQLSTVEATVAILTDFSSDDEQICLVIPAVIDAASSTDGMVSSVVGGTITVFWNTTKRTPRHMMAAIRFAHQLEARFEKSCTVGVAIGSMSSGNIGTSRQRFQSTFGPPVHFASAAAEHARAWGVFCLLADCTTYGAVAGDQTASRFARIVDCWRNVDGGALVRMYHPQLHRLDSLLQNFDTFDPPSQSTVDKLQLDQRTTDLLAAYFEEPTPTSFRTLTKHAKVRPNDSVLQQFVRVFRDVIFDGARCEVSLSNLPEAARIPELPERLLFEGTDKSLAEC
ncbi:Adenylate cyclase [Diplonema papillatum]|nr:Adenylate cyclase [Diplonema papillatum]